MYEKAVGKRAPRNGGGPRSCSPCCRPGLSSVAGKLDTTQREALRAYVDMVKHDTRRGRDNDVGDSSRCMLPSPCPLARASCEDGLGANVSACGRVSRSGALARSVPRCAAQSCGDWRISAVLVAPPCGRRPASLCGDRRRKVGVICSACVPPGGLPAARTLMSSDIPSLVR